ncbi:MAG: sigma-70 family RNA polymerase sigma factor [Bacteroidaceae bacterium]|nr:sigma-70 family RNA polymerase sigma factor [Bacteroidaceae bacterium]
MLTMEITRLIERCRQGDADALGELYKAYAQRMRGVCRRYISDEQTVEDVLHDAFVIIFTSFDRLRDVRRAEQWMMAITRNVASKCKEHLEALPTVSLEETSEVGLMVAEDEERDVRGVPLSEVVRMIDRLPAGYGQVFRLSVFEGMTHKEIAAMLGIEPHSSSSQLARAKKMLRKMMKQYWVAGLLLLLVPVTFFLLRKGDTAVKDEKPIVAKQKETPKESTKDSQTEQPQKPVIVHLPVHRTTVNAPDTLQSVIAQALDPVTSDTLSNIIVQDQTIPDTITTDTTKTIRKVEIPHYDITDLRHDKSIIGTDNDKKWSLQLAYAGQLDEQNRYNQPFSYKPTPSTAQSLPGPSPSPIIPTSIDNWTDYAVYLANHPDAVSNQTRSVIMRIALNNANRPGEDKILRTSHHRMPFTCSLALKYKLNDRFGLETGLSYSQLRSEFEMGANGNTINEQQTIHYLGIPLKGIYNMYDGKRWGVYGSLGLTTEIPVRSTLHSDFYVNGQYEASDQTDFRAPGQFSTTFGLGLQYHLTPYVGFFVEPSLQYFIPMKTDIETYRTEHPFTFSLPLGIRFTW